MDRARKAAVGALIKVHGGGWSNLSLKNVLAAPSLSLRDRAFAAALFYGTAERLVTLDYLIAPLLKKPLERLDVEVRAVLETGLYQMLYMHVPPRAAVDEAVKLTRGFGKSSAAGFVNAVLRRLEDPAPPKGPFADETERVSVLYSVSPAVARALMAALPGEYEAYLAASFRAPRLCLRTNTFKTTTDKLEAALRQKGADVQRSDGLKDCLYVDLPGGVAGEGLFEEGLYQVQGEASQYAVACLAPRHGERVLDLCAAPGGKSAMAAMLMGASPGERPGAGVWACDVRENRVELMARGMKRMGLGGVRVLQNDASKANAALAGFDRVLCDAPCSGLGVLGKKPDLRYGDGGNWRQLEKLQAQILQNAAAATKRGGRLVYATCTIRREENENIVRGFLAQNEDFALVVPPKAPEGAVVRDNMMTILPQKTGLDGFFVATLERL